MRTHPIPLLVSLSLSTAACLPDLVIVRVDATADTPAPTDARVADGAFEDTVDASIDATRDTADDLVDASSADMTDVSSVDAPDAACPMGTWPGDEGCAPITAPRLRAPSSSSFVRSRRPVLRWARTSPAPVRVELCRARDCAEVLVGADVDGETFTMPEDLPPGVVFWRVRAGATTSATWEMVVPRRSSPRATHDGAFVDLNGDGYGDVLVLEASGLLDVHTGGPTGLSSTPTRSVMVEGLPPEDFLTRGAIRLVGDLDGDGYVDLFVERGGVLRTVRGGATPTLVTTPWASLSGVSVGLAPAGDVDGDGYADLLELVSNGADAGAGNSLVTRFGDAALRFSRSAEVLRAAATLTVTTHLAWNDDAFADVFLVDSNDMRHALFGSARGLVEGSTFAATVSANARFSSAGDVDGDGRTDLFARELRGSGASSLVVGASVVRGDVTDGASVRVQALRGTSAIALGDLNGDGFDDVACTREGSTASIADGICFGSASGPTIASADSPVRSGAIFGRDLNGDGFVDLLTLSSRNLSVFPGGVTLPTTPARTFSLGGLTVAVRAPQPPRWLLGRPLRGA